MSKLGKVSKETRGPNKIGPLGEPTNSSMKRFV